MIETGRGNLLEADVEALVNTVNSVGIMGKGIALQFKQAWPGNFQAYEKACKAGMVGPGRMFVYETMEVMNPRFIINFPTKRHWRGKSKIEDIKSGLLALTAAIKRYQIKSIAIPPLGCGNGGLDWSVVRPLIEKEFISMPEVQVLIFEPDGAPVATEMPIRTQRPKMTVARALFVKLMEKYSTLNYRLTLLEIQKLAYFLQEAGEPLRLKYQEAHYGPYANNLNKVLEILEGHFITGYGDSQKPEAEIDLLPGATDIADEFLSKHDESNKRLEQVSELIEGFETPYGMELLSTVHWVRHHQQPPAIDEDTAINSVQEWSERKHRLFKPRHIHIAWERLHTLGWMS